MKKTENQNQRNLPAVIETATPVKFIPHPTGTAWLHQDPPTYINEKQHNKIIDELGILLDVFV